MGTMDARLIQGDSIRLKLTAKNLTDGSVIDLTGVSIKFILVAEDSLNGAISFTATTENGKIVIPNVSPDDAEHGRFDVLISATDSETLKGKYLGEAQITDTMDNIITLRNDDLTPGKYEFVRELIPNT